MVIMKDKKDNHRKSPELKHHSTTNINDVANKIDTNEFVQKEVPSEQIVDKSEKDFTKDCNSIVIQINSSQQTEVTTSDFGGQKNDDEVGDLLKKQEQPISIFKESIKENQDGIKELRHDIFSQQKTIVEQRKMIEEREKIINERERMVGERDVMIKEREQKIKEYEDKRYVTDRELASLERRNISLVTKLNDKVVHCKKNPKEKRKSRKRKAKPQFPYSSAPLSISNHGQTKESQQIRVQGPNFEFEWTAEPDILSPEYPTQSVTSAAEIVKVNEQVNRFFLINHQTLIIY